MIDPNLPLELDDGTPAVLVRIRRYSVRVNVPKYLRNANDQADHAGDFSYELKTGVWSGGSAERMFTLRNVVDDEADYVHDI